VDRLSGFVFFGSDGAAELFGFDFRKAPPSVVMVNNVAEGWHKAIPQAGSFQAFIERCRLGQDFNFQDGFE